MRLLSSVPVCIGAMRGPDLRYLRRRSAPEPRADLHLRLMNRGTELSLFRDMHWS